MSHVNTGSLGENLSSRYRSIFSYVLLYNSEFLHSKYIENKILNWNLAGSLQICNIAYDLPVARSSRINPFVFLAIFHVLTSSAKKAADGGERAEAEASGVLFIVTPAIALSAFFGGPADFPRN